MRITRRRSLLSFTTLLLTESQPARAQQASPAFTVPEEEQVTMPRVDPMGLVQFSIAIVNLSLGLINVTEWVNAEPPLPEYAAPYSF